MRNLGLGPLIRALMFQVLLTLLGRGDEIGRLGQKGPWGKKLALGRALRS